MISGWNDRWSDRTRSHVKVCPSAPSVRGVGTPEAILRRVSRYARASVLAAILALALIEPELEWHAPPGCPDVAELLERISEQADGALVANEALVAVGHVEQSADGRWILELDLFGEGPGTHRVIEGETCEAITNAAAIILALRRVEAPAESQVLPAPQPQERRPPSNATANIAERPLAPATRDEGLPSPSAMRHESRQPPPRDPIARTIHGWLAAAGGLALGILPGVGGAASVEGGISGRFWRFGLGVRGFPARTNRHPQDPEITGRFDLVSGSIIACGIPLQGRWLLSLCARFEAGAVRGVGEGAVSEPRPRWSPWMGAGATVAMAWWVLPRFAPFVALDGIAGVLRPAFVVGRASGDLFVVRTPGFRAWLGVEVRIPFALQKTAGG